MIGSKGIALWDRSADIIGNLDKIKGIYAPIWLFEVSAKSDWWGGYNKITL